MIRGCEGPPPPQRRYKTELLYKLKFPSSWIENTEIVHIWQNNRNADLENYKLVKPGEPGFKIPRKREDDEHNPPPSPKRRIGLADRHSTALFQAIEPVYRPQKEWSRPRTPVTPLPNEAHSNYSLPVSPVTAARAIQALRSKSILS